MDSGGAEVNYCIGTKPSVFAGPEEVVDKLEDEEGKRSPLLRPAMNRRLVRKRQETSSRKVQWNDHNGNNLVEVFELQPSDSSISGDKRGCVCAVM